MSQPQNPYENYSNDSHNESSLPDYDAPASPQTAQPYGGESSANDPYFSSANTQDDPYATQYGTSAEQPSVNSSQTSSANTWQEAPQSAPTGYNTPYKNQQPYSLDIKALLGIIFAFVFFPAGLILSWLGFNESKRTGDPTARTLSLVGLIVSGIQTAIFVLYILFIIVLIIASVAGQ